MHSALVLQTCKGHSESKLLCHVVVERAHNIQSAKHIQPIHVWQ